MMANAVSNQYKEYTTVFALGDNAWLTDFTAWKT
jgi:hypothetical protein